jgi:hypothetical protein
VKRHCVHSSRWRMQSRKIGGRDHDLQINVFSLSSSQMWMVCLLGDVWQWWLGLHGAGGAEDELGDGDQDDGDELGAGDEDGGG